MPRLMLSDELWSKVQTILLHKAIYNKRNLRMTVEGMLYRMIAKEVIVADKGYDSETIREQIKQQGARAVIPRRRNSVKGNTDMD